MFEKVKSFVKGVFRKMYSADSIEQKLGFESCLSDTMQERINFWGNMYRGNAPWCDDYVKSVRAESGTCIEFSNISLNEMTSQVSNERLDKIYKKAIRDLNENLQSGLAYGSFIIKPLGEDKIEYVTADKFIPIEFDSNGRLVDVCFVQHKKIKNKIYHRFERHTLQNNILTITNKAFVGESENDIGKEIKLEIVDEWSSLPEQISYAGLEKPDFGYYRNPIKNEIDGSFCGVSIYENAINDIRKVDVQAARLEWEFESGERAVHIDSVALQPKKRVENGKVYFEAPKLNKRLYRGLNLEIGADKELYQEWSPEFRDSNIINGLNQYLRRVEFNVCLAYGDLSDVNQVEKTAEEVRVSKQRKYNMVTSIQENLKECLEDLVYALAFYNSMLRSGYEFSCVFDDSILTDPEKERQQDRQDVSMGVMSHLEYRMKWYNEDEATAKKNLPEQNQVME